MLICTGILYLITQDLVNKLSNCESTCLETADDVRDEMINNIDMRDFGSRLLVFLGGASVISCNRTSNGELY